MERVLIESAVRALLLAIAVGAVLRVARIHTAAARHAAWTIVMASMLALPLWVLVGNVLAQHVNTRHLTIAAGLGFIVIGLWTLWGVLRG